MNNDKGMLVKKVLKSKNFLVLGTASESGRPHSSGVLYELVGDTIYIHTTRSSRKFKNVSENPHVAVTVPYRRIPVGPPSTIQFQGWATVMREQSAGVHQLIAQGHFQTLLSKGAENVPDGVFLRIGLPRVIHTFGVEGSLWKWATKPLETGSKVVMY